MLQLVAHYCTLETCRHGCTRDTGCQGIEWRMNHAPGYYLDAAQRLVEDAARDGLVVTIEQRPRTPLAMGNYDTVANVRPINRRKP